MVFIPFFPREFSFRQKENGNREHNCIIVYLVSGPSVRHGVMSTFLISLEHCPDTCRINKI